VSAPRLETHLPRHDWIAVRRFTPDRAAPRGPVVHDHASVALWLGGHAKFWMQGLYTLGAGDLMLIPDATPHYMVEANGARSIGVSLCLSCAPTPVRERLTALFDAARRGSCALRHLGADDARRLEGVLLDLERELAPRRATSTVAGDLAVEAGVSLLTVAILRATEGRAAERQPGASPVVARALEFVHRNGSTGISLRDVASHVARSPAHVASLVKDATGVTVVGWITRARLSEARQLLLHTDESVEVIAERCGFASPSHFHRAFKRAHDAPPGEWRRAHRA
jgi:AraC-like DNA-binding protein